MLAGMARLAVAATTDHRNHSPVHDCRRRFRHTRRDQTLPRRFLDPASESARATATLAENFNQGDMELVLLVGSASGAKGGPAQAAAPTSPNSFPNPPSCRG